MESYLFKVLKIKYLEVTSTTGHYGDKKHNNNVALVIKNRPNLEENKEFKTSEVDDGIKSLRMER